MNKTIRYHRTVTSAAMSKRPRQNGLSLDYEDGLITVQAINPKTGDITSHLRMEIPIENLQQVIDALMCFK